ncbi:MAG: nucleotidyltransferase family protein [Phycisphaerae bacterium]
MIILRDIIQRRDDILAVAGKYGAHDVRIFGSVARGQAGASSDLDMVVRFDPDRTLFDHGGLVMDLQDLLGVHVDVLDEEALRPRFRNHVMKEAVTL